ncbi:MAG TPA: nuclear transport factor 2 family protein [Solirubrobacterales bacterium]
MPPGNDAMQDDATAERMDRVLRAYEGWNRDGVQRFSRFLSDDATLADAPELPDARMTRGRPEVVRRLEEVARSVGGGSVEIRGVEPRGDAVLVTMTWNLEASGGAEVSVGDVFHLVEVEGDKICGIRVFLHLESVPDA